VARPLAERLAERVQRTDDPAQCWLWTGAVNNKGYGYFVRVKPHKVLAHRLAWELAYGPIPDGLGVLHRCDTPRCCNPAHLFLGTQAANMLDAATKGRVRHSEAHHRAKLTSQNIRDIRAATGTHQAIADRYGVTRPLITKIRRGEIWRHLA
jgi:hypothetical protein